MKNLSKFLYICTYICIPKHEISRAIYKAEYENNFSEKINDNYNNENNQIIISLNTQKMCGLKMNERIRKRIKTPKNMKNKFKIQKQVQSSYRKSNCSKSIIYHVYNLYNERENREHKNNRNYFQIKRIRECRITAGTMIDHHYHQTNRREIDQVLWATKDIKQQITTEDLKIEKITAITNTKMNTMTIIEAHQIITKIAEDQLREVTVNMTIEDTMKYHHQDHQVEVALAGKEDDSVSTKVRYSFLENNVKCMKQKTRKLLKYLLVWESRHNWTATPGSHYVIPESAKNRSKRNNGINGPDIVSKIEWAGNFQLSELERSKTWELDETEGERYMLRVNKVKVNPLQRHAIIRLCDKIGILPDDVDDMNDKKDHWQLKNDDEVVSIRFKHIFKSLKFSVFYNNKLSADGVWKTISLLKFIYDAFIPQNFSKGNNLYVCLPEKEAFVTKFKSAFNEPKFQKCLNMDDINIEIRKLECLRMKNDPMFAGLDLHPQFQHRAEDIKGTAIQLASRFLISNQKYDTDQYQKNFLQTQIEYNKRPFPDMNSFWMILNNSEDEKGYIKERAWNNELKRPDARNIPELIKLMGHNDGLKNKQHTMDEDENQMFHIRCRNNMMVRYVYPLKMAGTVETFNPDTNKNEYKSSVNLFDLSVTVPTSNTNTTANSNEVRQLNNDMQSNLTLHHIHNTTNGK